MRTPILVSVSALLASFTFGCAGGSSYVHSEAALGRVVIYRNGVAYFERYAKVSGDMLRLSVPADKVDDFLKSLTVVDAHTGQPAPIAYPTAPNPEKNDSGLIDMNIQLPGPSPHELKISYVTESPSWKPSYRVMLGQAGKVNVQAWAIVDNTSGEDWKAVKLGVGASSALSFRYDLRTIRTVERETLNPDDLFAQAPPLGGATHAQELDQGRKVLTALDDASIGELAFRAGDGEQADKKGASKNAFEDDPLQAGGFGAQDARIQTRSAPPASPASPPPPVLAGSPSTSSSNGAGKASGMRYRSLPTVKNPIAMEAKESELSVLKGKLRASTGNIVVEGYADPSEADKNAASLARANKVREELVRSGIAANRVSAIGAGVQPGRTGGVRILEAANAAPADASKSAKRGAKDASAGADAEPIGTSHFESSSPMSVDRGTSAMVSILHDDTDGEVVYLYDPETSRGNASFPFRSVRLKNPTDSALESGPVTVFGEGKFIGEGLTEPIPAHAVAFVPFALDRQIVVDRHDGERDEIARILAVQRGVFSTEVRHTRKTTLTIHNRLSEKSIVYIRHTVPDGFTLSKSPGQKERLGAAYLFRVEVEPSAKIDVDIEETTPLYKTTDIRSTDGMDLVQAYLSASVEAPLRTAIADLLKTHTDMANLEQQIASARDQMAEYKARMDELHVQIVTLRAVKSSGNLVQHLEKKLGEVSDKLSQSTLDLVTIQEKLMVARIRFQDGVAELSLEKKGT